MQERPKKPVRPRLAALSGVARRRRFDPPTALRIKLLGEYRSEIARLDTEEKEINRQLAELVRASGSTLGELWGLATVSVAELLVEVGDPRRFTIGGFGRFNGTAPLAASTAEGSGEPVRHRYNPGGNRRVNAILHRMAITSRATSHAPNGSPPRRAPTVTPRGRPAGSSSATSPMSSTAA